MRTVQIFSPVAFDFSEDMGRNVFKIGSVHALGYDSYNSCIVYQQPTYGAVPSCGLRQFISMLEEPAGILELETHSSFPEDMGGGVFMVEVYRADTSTTPDHQCDFAEDQRQLYIDDEQIQEDEMEVHQDGNYCVLRAKPIFVTRKLTAPHGIVHAMFCKSAQQWPVWVDQHMVRNYVSYADAVPKVTNLLGSLFYSNGRVRTQYIFENMSGTRNDVGNYGNQTISNSVAAANSKILVSSPIGLYSDTTSPDASKMRLYNAPRLVKAEITQGVASVYSFSTSVSTYPYTDYLIDYLTDRAGGVAPEPADKDEPLHVLLKFSEPMNRNSLALSLKQGSVLVPLQLPSDGFGASDDTWSGSIPIPANAPEGEVALQIAALRLPASADDTVKEMDPDGDGASEGPDSSVVFRIATLPPYLRAVTVTQDGNTVYQAHWTAGANNTRASSPPRAFHAGYDATLRTPVQQPFAGQYGHIRARFGDKRARDANECAACAAKHYTNTPGSPACHLMSAQNIPITGCRPFAPQTAHERAELLSAPRITGVLDFTGI
ncbi:MAG: hypothetical protein PHP45_00980 [Elusimicrobiales bacterium]|nr:hypothetical protein [Elusimicrobiales bacterium]